ncbi:hypothetical protein [Bizionia arctica]|uniref:SGNH/GDSL hydrolase family protein n=1 Tax=Bizionia arctica TaxID=1495645 RepID=A0A917GRD1_9FLAO|nr:hypothetical protein [Bizionia arctica]GGG54664.1 hypothetical protein GCM10010976_27010 [Bizionia arctica]
MRKLLTHIGLFLIPILVVWILAELFYRTVPNTYTYKNNQILNENNDVNMLVFGDSHTFYGINPEWLSVSSFNLANISQTIYFDKLLLEKHINHLPKLKYVIISVEYTTLSQIDNTQEDIWRKYFYSAQMDLEVPIIDWYNPKKYSLALTRKFNKTWKSYRDYRTEGTLIGSDVNGWGNTYLATVDSLELKTIAKNISRKHEDGSMDFSLNIGRIQQIIDLCKERHIEVILINMPVTKDYLDLLNPEKLKKIEATCDRLVKNNTNVKRLSFLRDPRFTTADFQDADHLNAQGAKKCSLLINEYLEKN